MNVRLIGSEWSARTAGAALAGLLLAAAALAPSRGDAASPIIVPACGQSHAAGAAIPASVPVRDAEVWPAPAITAKAAVVVDAETGRVLYDLNADQRRSPASTTKIMTAILALENVSEDNWVVSQTDATAMTESSVMGLWPGEFIRMRDLLYGLMLPSGNDAAIEIARNVDGSVPAFVDRMNARVADLGLKNTHFTNPHGLDHRRHYSSAYDLAMISRYAMANERFRAIASTPAYMLDLPGGDGYEIYNGNSLLANYPGADGVKIGWTDRAGWTLVGSAVRDGHRIFVTVLDSEDRDADAAALMDWAFATYRWESKHVRVLHVLQRLGLGDGLMAKYGACG